MSLGGWRAAEAYKGASAQSATTAARVPDLTRGPGDPAGLESSRAAAVRGGQLRVEVARLRGVRVDAVPRERADALRFVARDGLVVRDVVRERPVERPAGLLDARRERDEVVTR